MFFYIITIGMILAVLALLFFEGLWASTITLMNLWFTSMIALNYYEPLATFIDENMKLFESQPNYTEYVVFWLLFSGLFGVLRVFSRTISKYRVTANKPVEIIGSLLVATTASCLFTSIVLTSFHFGPTEPSPLGGDLIRAEKVGENVSFKPGLEWYALSLYGHTTNNAFLPFFHNAEETEYYSTTKFMRAKMARRIEWYKNTK
ncbi:MAG: hypothetical protein MPJ24_06240 [Pirellulaceae bacterium]|nr:hypothetical protein [Pirellulaceae bacterium]